MANETDERLEPCPFCQSAVEWDEENHYVICYECGFTYGPDTSQKKTIEFWNRRTYPAWVHVLADAADEQIGYLKVAYKGYEDHCELKEYREALAAYRKATGKEE